MSKKIPRGGLTTRIGIPKWTLVNLSGGNWIGPASADELMTERSGEQIVKGQCIKCHEEGEKGAPKIGGSEAWVQRIMKQHGLEYLARSAIRGHGGMPPRDRKSWSDPC